MKLDKRITEDYKIYTCFNVEQAQEYVNTKGDWMPFGVEDEL